MDQAPSYITNGVLPYARAYMLALETTHAGESEIPYVDSRKKQVAAISELTENEESLPDTRLCDS